MPIYIGDNTNITGQLVDTNALAPQLVPLGCPEEGIKVKLSASDPVPNVVWTGNDNTNSQGTFFGGYKTVGVAGTHTIKLESPIAISKTVAVHPVATSLSGEIGGVAGGQPVKLTGDGFQPGTTKIAFRGPKRNRIRHERQRA